MEKYTKTVKRNIEAVKGQIRRRRFIIAIDETHNPFYGKIKDQLIRDYTHGVKSATGSYKYIVVSIVSGDLYSSFASSQFQKQAWRWIIKVLKFLYEGCVE